MSLHSKMTTVWLYINGFASVKDYFYLWFLYKRDLRISCLCKAKEKIRERNFFQVKKKRRCLQHLFIRLRLQGYHFKSDIAAIFTWISLENTLTVPLRIKLWLDQRMSLKIIQKCKKKRFVKTFRDLSIPFYSYLTLQHLT